MMAEAYGIAVAAAVRNAAPATLGELQHSSRGPLAKWWYGNPALQYGTANVLRAAVSIKGVMGIDSNRARHRGLRRAACSCMRAAT